jgi:hypothetical protein
MSSTDIKEVVKEKYGQAALRVTSGGRSRCGATASSGLAAIRLATNLSMTQDKLDRFLKRLCSLPSGAETRLL